MVESWRGVGRRAAVVFAGTLAGLVVLVGLWAVWRPSALPLHAGPDALGSATRGASLAETGNCKSCHTAPDGAAYAGGVALGTPFGTIYSTDITPAPGALGGWSFAAFERAMREGVSRDGHYLYPAFPYDHFRRLRTDDLEDLYAFLMRLSPVEATPPRNRLLFPFGFRPLLAVWDFLFLRGGPEPETDRGDYLVDALAHCGACHAPRGTFGQEKGAMDGGVAEGWYAPPLDGASPAPRAWTADDLFLYLRTGLSDRHAAAAGPMGEVARSLSAAPQDDVRAIAASIAARMPQTERVEPPREAAGPGAALFTGACAACHGEGAAMIAQGRPPLAFGTPLYEATPRDTLAILLRGLNPPVGRSGPYMPGFADTLDDEQIGQVAAYLRARFTALAPWPQDLAREARAARTETAP